MAGLPDDTRGILDPAAMLRHVRFDRYDPGEALDGLVAWFWSVDWDLGPGVVHDQEVLNHPAGHISVGTLDEVSGVLDPPDGRVYGVLTGVSHRRLEGRGWTVAARTAVGGLGLLVGRPAREAADRQLDFGSALAGVDADRELARILAVDGNRARIERLRETLERVVEARDPAQVAEAREVARIADLAERDRSVCRVEQLASAAGMSVRTLQRLFDQHVGAGPSFVIRRWRIIEAAEAAREAGRRQEPWPGWAQVAAELGYADQAHLTRDFRRHLGVSPSAYVARNRDLRSPPDPSR